MKDFKNKEFFYCYSSQLFQFLKLKKKLNYICCGLHEQTMKKFWQFEGTEELNNAINEYRKLANRK